MDFSLQNPPENGNDNTNSDTAVATLTTIGEIGPVDDPPQSNPVDNESGVTSRKETPADGGSTGRDGTLPQTDSGNKSRQTNQALRESRIPRPENYNLRSPAVKRLLREAQEMSREPNDDFKAVPLEDNLFEWHFTIRGPADTEFSQGVYHGRIMMPPEYPMKPPAIMMLTPNGRFETGTKICLSISNFHPETWRPSWSIRTALVALISFMATPSPGAIGSLECSPEIRRSLARKSVTWTCPECGPIIDDVSHSHSHASENAPSDNSPAAQRVFRLPHERRPDELHDAEVVVDDEPSEPHIPLNEAAGVEQGGDNLGLAHQIHAANMELNYIPLPAMPEDNTAFTVCVGVLVFSIAALVFRRVYMTNMFRDIFEF